MATPEATAAYRNRYLDEFHDRYFRSLDGLAVSSIGLGTYLGEPSEAVDEAYHESIETALESGINVVDTAINYRHQRSERVVGRALGSADPPREAVVVATKGGYLPFDGSRANDEQAYVQERFVEPGVVDWGDLAMGLHAITPSAVEWMLDRSRENLGLDTIDLYYVHNPEEQLAERPREAVYDQLEATFRRLEERAADGDIQGYGVATWDAFRVPRSHDRYLSMAELVDRASTASAAAGTAEHHFAAVQLPFNPLAGEALTMWEQDSPDGEWNALGAAEKLGLSVVTSASLAQGRAIAQMADDVAAWFDGDTTAQRAINFARSGPGVVCALVGMRSTEHVWENVRAGHFRDLGSEAFELIFEADR